MALSGSFSNHIVPAIREVVGTGLGRLEAYYSRLYRVMTTERRYEDILHATGLPAAIDRDENEPIPFFDPIEGSTKRMTVAGRSIGFQVSRELWMDDLRKGNGSALREAAEMIRDSLAERIELDGVAPFNLGFSGGNFGTIDGATDFFSASHPRLDGGGNQSNLKTSHAFTISTMREILQEFMTYKNDAGIRIPLRGDLLVIPPNLHYSALETLVSPDKPSTANRAVNVTQNVVQPITYPYLTSTTTWFLRANRHYLYWLWRERPFTENFDDKNTRTAKFAAHMRYDRRPIWFLGWYGCQA